MMAEKIKILLIKTGMNVVQLAKAKQTSSQNIVQQIIKG